MGHLRPTTHTTQHNTALDLQGISRRSPGSVPNVPTKTFASPEARHTPKGQRARKVPVQKHGRGEGGGQQIDVYIGSKNFSGARFQTRPSMVVLDDPDLGGCGVIRLHTLTPTRPPPSGTWVLDGPSDLNPKPETRNPLP